MPEAQKAPTTPLVDPVTAEIEKYANEATTIFFVPDIGVNSDACAMYVEQKWPNSKAFITRVLRIGSLRADSVVIPVIRSLKPTQERFKGDDGGWGFAEISMEDLIKDCAALRPVLCERYWSTNAGADSMGYRWRNDGEIDPAAFQVALGQALFAVDPRKFPTLVARFQDAASRKNGEKPDQLVIRTS